MSEEFHKSCYTSRSSGYKYRTLATNTGERRRDSRVDSGCEGKFKGLKNEILVRIDREIDLTHSARDHILEKFQKIDAKINSMIEVQNSVNGLRKDLIRAENALARLIDKVSKIEMSLSNPDSEAQSIVTNYAAPIMEEEIFIKSY